MFATPKNVLETFSPESQSWLIAALDPYHDFQYSTVGLPDERCAPSVVQVHNQSVTISAPATAAGGNFDAGVWYSGLNSEINPASVGGLLTVATSNSHPYDHAALSTGQRFGALSWWTGAAGTNWGVGAPTVVGDGEGAFGSCMSTDRCRLIAVGFEIHNTTAEVYRQGSLTVAQLPDTVEDSRTVCYYDTNGAPNESGWLQGDTVARRALNSQSLLSIPGSQTWSAAEGVYAIPRMTKLPTDLHWFNPSPSRACVVSSTAGNTATPVPVATSALGPVNINPYIASGFSPIQVFFTGLSNQTTLTVTFRTIVEYFPNLGSTLLPLAEMPPPYDIDVIRAYSAIIHDAPYAVPVNQNSAGEYFRKVLKVVSHALNLAAPAFGTYSPLVALAAQGGQFLHKKLSEKVAKKEAGPGAKGQKPRK